MSIVGEPRGGFRGLGRFLFLAGLVVLFLLSISLPRLLNYSAGRIRGVSYCPVSLGYSWVNGSCVNISVGGRGLIYRVSMGNVSVTPSSPSSWVLIQGVNGSRIIVAHVYVECRDKRTMRVLLISGDQIVSSSSPTLRPG